MKLIQQELYTMKQNGVLTNMQGIGSINEGKTDLLSNGTR